MTSISNNFAVPKEIFMEIISYLSSKEKKITALVCKRFQMILEDPDLLRAELNAKRDLSVRQLSIIFSTAPSSDSAREILKKMQSGSFEGALSEKNLKLMLSVFKIPPSYDFISDFLITLECQFRKTVGFNSDKAVQIFYEYFKYSPEAVNSSIFYSEPIHLAAEQRNNVMIKALIKAGADVNKTCQYYMHETPASLLFSYSDTQKMHEEQTQCLETLIQAEADLTVHNRLVLWAAIRSGNEQAVKRLIDYGLDINEPNDFGHTPAQYAAGHQQTKIEKLLNEAMTIQKAAKKPRIDPTS